MNIRAVGDLSGLPEIEFGHRAPQWWGVAGIIAIEGTIFALCLAVYFYLRLQEAMWPPYGTAPPSMIPGAINTALILLAIFPMKICERRAKRGHVAHTLLYLAIFVLINIAILVVRYFEFRDLHVKWDTNAYGSIVWLTIIFHSLHVLTTFIENGVLAVYLATHSLEEKRVLDIELSLVYWYFIAASWMAIYAVICFGPLTLN